MAIRKKSPTTMTLVQVVSDTAVVLTPEQQAFHDLLKMIEREKKKLATWQTAAEQCQRDVLSKLIPLRHVYAQQQGDLIRLIDELSQQHRFSRPQQAKLHHLIHQLYEQVLPFIDDADLQAIYQRYNQDDSDPATADDQAEIDALFKLMLKEEFGVDLEIEQVDIHNEDELTDLLTEHLKRQQQADEERRSKQKKSTKQTAQAAREQAEAATLKKSIQTLYRELVAALHPDREPDPAERERKTDLMQKVTVAYKQKDLLQLLELQLVAMQLSGKPLTPLIDNERIKQYNKVLHRQLAEVQLAVHAMEAQLKDLTGLRPQHKLTPTRLKQSLKAEITQLQQQSQALKHDMPNLRQIAYFKQWLKQYRIPDEDDW